MRRSTLAALVLLPPLAACTTDAEREARAAPGDHAQCLSYGIGPNDPRYADCRLAVARLRAEREADRDAAIDRALLSTQGLGNSMIRAGQRR